MMSKLSLALGVLCALQSCMPSKSADSTKKPTQTNSETGTQSSSLSDIGASQLFLIKDGVKVSLADIARANSSALTVFQFSGVDCLSCRTESPQVGQALTKYGSNVSRVVIFPNPVDEYPASSYQEFTRQYANNAPYANETGFDLSVLRTIRATNTQYFGIYVLVSKNGLGQVLNMDQAYLRVDAAVAKALGQ